MTAKRAAFQGLSREFAIVAPVALGIYLQAFGLDDVAPVFVDHGASF
jgi:hypothetical protein